MKTYINTLIIFGALLTLLNACATRSDAVDELNDAPMLRILRLQGIDVSNLNLDPLGTIIKDSLKNSLKVQQRYKAKLEVSDINQNLASLHFVQKSGEGSFFVNDSLLSNNTGFPNLSLQAGTSSLSVSYLPKTGVLGAHSFELVASDQMGKSKVMAFELVCFDNLAPQAELSVDFTGPDAHQYQFDFTRSKDADQKFGGVVLFYNVRINNGRTITETLRKFPYIFNEGSGNYLIEYWVSDSDGTDSEVRQMTLNIN